MINPKAIFRAKVENFLRESFKNILIHCLDQTYDCKLYLYYVSRDIFVLYKLWFLSLNFVALGFGIHIVHLLQRLQNFTRPSISCGWDCGSIIRHVHVLVNKPNGGFYSSVNVKLPHEHLHDAFRRVSFFLMTEIGYFSISIKDNGVRE